MGVAQTVLVPKAAPQRSSTAAVRMTMVVALAVEYHHPDGRVRVDVGVGVGTVFSSVFDLSMTLPPVGAARRRLVDVMGTIVLEVVRGALPCGRIVATEVL